MGIDAITNLQRAALEEPEDLAAPPGARSAHPNTVQTYQADAPPPTTPSADSPLDVGQLLAQLFAGGKTSSEQANHFDFFALLAKIFEGASLPATPKEAPPAPTTSGELGSGEVRSRLSNAALGAQDSDQGFKQSVHAQGSTSLAGATLAGTADAAAYARAGTTTSSAPGAVAAEADARLGVSASASGAITSRYGSISGNASVTAEIYAHAKAYAEANAHGATAGANAEVGAHVKAQAQADAVGAGGLVTGHAEATAEAGAGGKAGAKVGVSYDPPSTVVDASADAFAGARAAFDAKGGVAGMTYGIHGEAWAGVGAKVEVEAGLTDGKFHFSFGAGISLGVGTFLKFDFEIDLKPIQKAFGDLVGAIAGLFGGGSGDGTHAASAITDAVNRAQPGSVPTTPRSQALREPAPKQEDVQPEPDLEDPSFT
jgi:hypothetical protein